MRSARSPVREVQVGRFRVTRLLAALVRLPLRVVRPGPSTREASSSVSLERGVDALERGDWASAVTCLDDAIRLAPADPTAHLYRGIAHYHGGDLDRAVQDYTA